MDFRLYTKKDVERFIENQVKKSIDGNLFFSRLPSTPRNSTELFNGILTDLVSSTSSSTFPRNGVKKISKTKHGRQTVSAACSSVILSSDELDEKHLPPTKRKCIKYDNEEDQIVNVKSLNDLRIENGSDKNLPKRIHGAALPSSVSIVRKAASRPKVHSPMPTRSHRSKSKSPKIRKKRIHLSDERKISFEQEKFTFFFTKKYPFSNHYPCQFLLEKHTFMCTEQYYMYRKALTFNDDRATKQILECNEPKKMKLIGSRINGFVQSKWDSTSEKFMFLANHAKYTQNRDLRLALFATEGTTLVETNPTDQRWGIGLSMNDQRAYCRSTWRGQNLLGRILTKIRDNLMQEKDYEHDVSSARTHKTKYLWWKNDEF